MLLQANNKVLLFLFDLLNCAPQTPKEIHESKF